MVRTHLTQLLPRQSRPSEEHDRCIPADFSFAVRVNGLHQRAVQTQNCAPVGTPADLTASCTLTAALGTREPHRKTRPCAASACSAVVAEAAMQRLLPEQLDLLARELHGAVGHCQRQRRPIRRLAPLQHDKFWQRTVKLSQGDAPVGDYDTINTTALRSGPHYEFEVAHTPPSPVPFIDSIATQGAETRESLSDRHWGPIDCVSCANASLLKVRTLHQIDSGITSSSDRNLVRPLRLRSRRHPDATGHTVASG